MVLSVQVQNSSGNNQVVYFTKTMYVKPMNGTRYFDILIDGTSDSKRTDFQVGFKVFIYWNGVLDLKGKIKKITNTSTGEMLLEGIGYGESVLSQPNTAEQGFSATTTTGVVSSGTNNLLSFVSGITVGTIENQTVTNFRTYTAQTSLEAVDKLCSLTDQDWSIDDVNDELDVLDHQGSSSSVGTLVDGVGVYNISKQEDELETVTRITVIGKGYGAEQVSGVWGAGGANAPSWNLGENEKTVIDKSRDSAAECQKLAQTMYLTLSSNKLSYGFGLSNPYYSHTLGDVITLEAPNIGVTATDLRIVSTKRVVTTNSSVLYFEVRPTTEREGAIDSLAKSSAIARANREAVSFTQPTDDAKAGSGTITGDSHLHADGTYGTDSHLHADGTLATDNHLHADGTYVTTSATGNVALATQSDGVDDHTTGTYGTDDIGTTVRTLFTFSGPNSGSDYLVIHLDIYNDEATGYYLRFRAAISAYFPDSGGVRVYVRANSNMSLDLRIPIGAFSSSSASHSFQVYTNSGSDLDIDFYYDYYYTDSHKHTIPALGITGNSENNNAGISGNSETTSPGVSGDTADHTH